MKTQFMHYLSSWVHDKIPLVVSRLLKYSPACKLKVKYIEKCTNCFGNVYHVISLRFGRHKTSILVVCKLASIINDNDRLS